MRNVAKKMYEKIEKLESEKVEVRREDKTIRPFTIPVQANITGEALKIYSFNVMQDHKLVSKTANIFLVKGKHLLIIGPNGIGKSTLIESLTRGDGEGLILTKGIRVGYYSQDFSTLNFEETVWECLANALNESEGTLSEHKLRSTAAGFLITADMINTKIGDLSEGQKGLVAFARLVLLQPGLLILDEPTNHINFRHLPVIAAALDSYEGAMVLVSHVYDFVAQVRIDEVLDLEK
jgi:ATP-binding cassette subfamily F protein 3